MEVQISENKRVEVSSFEEASYVCQHVIRTLGLKAGSWAGGKVFTGQTQVANITMNGRVWDMDGKMICESLSTRFVRMSLNKQVTIYELAQLCNGDEDLCLNMVDFLHEGSRYHRRYELVEIVDDEEVDWCGAVGPALVMLKRKTREAL